MTKREELRYCGRLYKCQPSVPYCGFLVKSDVMRKLLKITAKFETEIRHVLEENIDNIELSGWSLAYPNGKQTTVEFAEPAQAGEKIDRIKLFKARGPEYCPEVYICRAHGEDAKLIIKEIEEQ